MSVGAPWSVKGIDPKAREIAKDLARRSGMTLGEWLNQMILEDADEDLSRKQQPSERRARLRAVEGGANAAPMAAEEAEGGLDRVTRALEGLAERIEAAEQRSTQALSGVDRAVAGLLTRLDVAERTQGAASVKLERTAQELRSNQSQIAERLRRVEQEAAGPRSLEALKALEAAMGKLAGQLYEGDARTRDALLAIDDRIEQLEATPGPEMVVDGLVARIAERLEHAEARTSEAMRALEGSFSSLDHRLSQAESRLGAERETRFESLAEDLSRRFEAARDELARGLDQAVSGRFDRMERTLEHLTGHVEAAEKRSAEAIEQMGHEVVRIARNLDKRMSDVEQTSRRGLAETRGELARMAQAAEQRFRLAETGHAHALERLGQEIGRISEQMSERIAVAERRAEDAGERLERTAGKLEAQWGKASDELNERIRESEERTARLIEETREKIDRTLAGPAAAVEPMFEPALEPHAASGWDIPQAPAALHEPEDGDALFDEPGFELESEAGPARWAPAEPLAELDEEPFAAETEFLDEEGGEQPVLSTRAAIEAARAAARGGQRPAQDDRTLGFGLGGLKLGAKGKLSERVAKEAKRESSVVKTAALSSAFAVVLTSSVVGYKLILSRQPTWSPPTARKSAMGVQHVGPEPDTTPRAAEALTLPAPATPAPSHTVSAPLADLALATGLGPAAKSPEADASQLYAQAQSKLAAQQPGGVALLTKAANLGYTPAEFYLAKLYENGEAGLTRDPAAARRWTERAANAGEPRAMYNLALYCFDGVGGPKDLDAAAGWFRKAAQAGLVDSQYNLGRLYEQGYGVQRDAAEAYKWYLIAARAGDTESKAAAEQLHAGLSPQELKAAERAAAAFHAAGGAGVSQVASR